MPGGETEKRVIRASLPARSMSWDVRILPPEFAGQGVVGVTKRTRGPLTCRSGVPGFDL